MAAPVLVALEVGTAKTLALVGEMREDEQVMILGGGETPSAGIRKGEVIDAVNAAACVRTAIQQAEQNADVEIGDVLLAVSGGHIGSTIGKSKIPVSGRNRTVLPEDIDRVIDSAAAMPIDPDRIILHSIAQHFYLDDNMRSLRPEGAVASSISVEVLLLHGVRNRLQTLAQVAEDAALHVQDTVFKGLCASLAVLTPEQKRSGVIVIDLGHGTTDYLAYAGGVIAAAGALGVGGEHVTNDIAMAFRVPLATAERLKREHGAACVEAATGAPPVAVPPDVGFPGRQVHVRSLQTVINARLDEILTAIRRRLEREGVTPHQIAAGVVLTGGGARLRGIATLVERVFRLPCLVGQPRGVSGIASVADGPEYAVCAGLLHYGFREHGAGREPGLLKNLLSNMFGVVRRAARE